jgi:hypothetical protein
MITKSWTWLRKPANLKVAVFATGLLASLITGVWQLWLYCDRHFPSKPTLLVTVEKADLCYKFPPDMYENNIWGWTCPKGERCSGQIYQMSRLDIGINNPSERDLMITEVTLIPEWIFGQFWAGEVPLSMKYDLSLDGWYEFSMCAQLKNLTSAEIATTCPQFDRERLLRDGHIRELKMKTTGDWVTERTWVRPKEIKVTEIPGNKHTIKSKTVERFQIQLYLTEPTRYLHGTIYVQIKTDNGYLLKSERLFIFICSRM